MTTLDLGALKIAAAAFGRTDEDSGVYVALQHAITAYLDALSSIPEQGGNGFLTDGPADPDQYAAYVTQELKRPLAERLRLITHVGPYHLRNTPNEAADALAPSQPAAVAVTDEMVEAIVQAVRPYTHRTLFLDEHRDLVRAALRSTP